MSAFLNILFLLVCSVLNAQYKTEILVAKDGTGDFESIQAAIDGSDEAIFITGN